MTKGMGFSKFSAFTAILLLLLATVQCVASCALSPCEQSQPLPPCHRHNQTPASMSCNAPVLLAEARTHTAPPAIVVNFAVPIPALWQPADRHHHTSAPTVTSPPSITALRI
jgi:hypothetical protein